MSAATACESCKFGMGPGRLVPELHQLPNLLGQNGWQKTDPPQLTCLRAYGPWLQTMKLAMMMAQRGSKGT
jgi:hypothetical protein